ncbi:MAG: helix-turn-helix domain-containing protein [Prevotellaceae bacterium]|jgi:hypothetical protein|nr:helix-turn-helix domain-containing protein [Prevotellaceae bacterium]
MQEKTEKKSIFFERISQIIDFYRIKNVKSFACDYLGYESSQKINRLKGENTSPSYEILNDISNKFENINPEWLLTGRGEMLRQTTTELEQPKPSDDGYKEKYFEVLEKYTAALEEIKDFQKKLVGDPEDAAMVAAAG